MLAFLLFIGRLARGFSELSTCNAECCLTKLGMTMRQAESREQRWSSAQRRFLHASNALVRVHKLSEPLDVSKMTDQELQVIARV